MIKSIKAILAQDKEKFKVPRKVQDLIPIKNIWPDGIFKVGNKFSKSFRFSDINYLVASREDKESMFLTYSELLNSLDSGATTKITINNHRLNRSDFEESILMPMKQDGLDEYRKEYNDMLLDKATGANGITQEKYITITVAKKDIEEARAYFARIGADLTAHFANLGSKCVPLNAVERLRILHDFYRPGDEAAFSFDMNRKARLGHDFRDYICPDSVERTADHIKLGEKYARVLFLKDYASYIKDSMFSELTELNRNLMLSIDVIPIPTDEAVREVERLLLGVETNITGWQRRQNQNNNFSAVVPYDMELQRKESKEFLDDLTTRDQRMMFAVVTMVITADTKEQLDLDTETVLSTARKHMCQMATLKYQQTDGLNTVLPMPVYNSMIPEVIKMVSGTLALKNGYYYAVLSYQDAAGKRHQKWVSTGLPQKGNKRRAEQELIRIRSEFEIPPAAGELNSNMLFADYLDQWLEVVRARIKPATFGSYQGMVKSTIGPYFRKKELTLKELEARHIQQFYTEKLKTVTPNSVIHYHAVIYQALKYAMKTDMVPQNVAMKVDRPRKNSFQPTFLDAEQMQKLFEVVKGTRLELPVLVAAFYGLRRGEVLGLKWDAIDFNRGTLTIKRTVTEATIDGTMKIIEQDSAKTKSSLRTLPLVGSFRDYFQKVKEAQELNKKVCGNCYNYDYDGYVFVNELGERMRPNYLTEYFPKYIAKHGMPKMRFHDLRHSCASLLLANGVSLKQIQEWLGHSDFSTTANIYAHLDYRSKISSAQAMEQGMLLPRSDDFGSRWENVTEQGKITEPDLNPGF